MIELHYCYLHLLQFLYALSKWASWEKNIPKQFGWSFKNIYPLFILCHAFFCLFVFKLLFCLICLHIHTFDHLCHWIVSIQWRSLVRPYSFIQVRGRRMSLILTKKMEYMLNEEINRGTLVTTNILIIIMFNGSFYYQFKSSY